MAVGVSGDRHTRPGPHIPHHAQTLRNSPCHPPKRSHATALLDFAQAGPSDRNALLPSTMQWALSGLSQHPNRPHPPNIRNPSRLSPPALGAPGDSPDTCLMGVIAGWLRSLGRLLRDGGSVSARLKYRRAGPGTPWVCLSTG